MVKSVCCSIFIVSLAAFAWRIQADGDFFDCIEVVRNEIIAKSWQSSTTKNNPAGSKLCELGSIGPNFFRTKAGKMSADAGFHWFVMQLKNATWISRVIFGSEEHLINWASGVEVWTSAEATDFGSEHCDSQRISSVFESTRELWSFCGTSFPTAVGVTTAFCAGVKNARMVLLRRYVDNITNIDNQTMSFSHIYLKRVAIKANVEPTPTVKQNASVSVSCHVVCAESPSRVSLSQQDRNATLATGNEVHEIRQAQAKDSGTYRCSIGDQVISSSRLQVLHPPTRLTIEKRLSPKSRDVTFLFESSESMPEPKHNCSAFDVNGTLVDLQRDTNTVRHVNSQATRSLWVCSNCLCAVDLKVQCNAIQRSDSVEPLWNTFVANQFRLLDSNCTQSQGAVGFSPILLYTLVAVAISIAVAVTASAVACVLRKYRMTSSQVAVDETRDPPLDRPTATVSVLPAPIPSTAGTSQRPQSEPNFLSESYTGCTYIALSPRDTSASHNSRLDQETSIDSDVSVYLQIIADGP